MNITVRVVYCTRVPSTEGATIISNIFVLHLTKKDEIFFVENINIQIFLVIFDTIILCPMTRNK